MEKKGTALLCDYRNRFLMVQPEMYEITVLAYLNIDRQ